MESSEFQQSVDRLAPNSSQIENAKGNGDHGHHPEVRCHYLSDCGFSKGQEAASVAAFGRGEGWLHGSGGCQLSVAVAGVFP